MPECEPASRLRAVALSDPRLSIRKFRRILRILFSRINSGLCIYHLVVLFIIFSTKICRVLYSFCANLLPLLIIGLMVSSLSTHNLRLLRIIDFRYSVVYYRFLQFSCVLSIFAILVCIIDFCYFVVFYRFSLFCCVLSIFAILLCIIDFWYSVAFYWFFAIFAMIFCYFCYSVAYYRCLLFCCVLSIIILLLAIFSWKV